MGGTRAELPDEYVIASPLSWVTADDPPAYLYHGNKDWLVPEETALRFVDGLKLTGVNAKLQMVPDAGHVQTFSQIRWLREGIEFVEQELGRR